VFRNRRCSPARSRISHALAAGALKVRLPHVAGDPGEQVCAALSASLRLPDSALGPRVVWRAAVDAPNAASLQRRLEACPLPERPLLPFVRSQIECIERILSQRHWAPG